MIYTIFISHYIYSLIVAPIIDQINPSTQTLTVRENEQIHLQCVASGYPKPKITWRRDDDRPIHIDRIACMFSFSCCFNIFFSIINDDNCDTQTKKNTILIEPLFCCSLDDIIFLSHNCFYIAFPLIFLLLFVVIVYMMMM